MNHTLNMLEESVQRVLAEVVIPRRTIEAQAEGIDTEAWQALNSLGLVGADAASMSLAEFAVVIEAVAASGALVPYADSEAIGRWLASAADFQFDDAQVLTVGVVPVGAARRNGSELTLNLEGILVPWVGVADQVLLSWEQEGECGVAAIARQDLTLRAFRSMAGEPHGVLQGKVVLNESSWRAVSTSHGPQAVQQRGALVRSIQMLGAMTRANALTLQYARDRKQFKRSLSDFQVIQSHLAAMAGELCAASGLVALAIETGSSDLETVAATKSRVGQAARLIAQMGHQIHGAIGFTEEYPLNLSTRRLWTWREEYGHEADWAAQLGRAIISRGADALWPHMTQHEEKTHA